MWVWQRLRLSRVREEPVGSLLPRSRLAPGARGQLRATHSKTRHALRRATERRRQPNSTRSRTSLPHAPRLCATQRYGHVPHLEISSLADHGARVDDLFIERCRGVSLSRARRSASDRVSAGQAGLRLSLRPGDVWCVPRSLIEGAVCIPRREAPRSAAWLVSSKPDLARMSIPHGALPRRSQDAHRAHTNR